MLAPFTIKAQEGIVVLQNPNFLSPQAPLNIQDFSTSERYFIFTDSECVNYVYDIVSEIYITAFIIRSDSLSSYCPYNYNKAFHDVRFLGNDSVLWISYGNQFFQKDTIVKINMNFEGESLLASHDSFSNRFFKKRPSRRIINPKLFKDLLTFELHDSEEKEGIMVYSRNGNRIKAINKFSIRSRSNKKKIAFILDKSETNFFLISEKRKKKSIKIEIRQFRLGRYIQKRTSRIYRIIKSQVGDASLKYYLSENEDKIYCVSSKITKGNSNTIESNVYSIILKEESKKEVLEEEELNENLKLSLNINQLKGSKDPFVLSGLLPDTIKILQSSFIGERVGKLIKESSIFNYKTDLSVEEFDFIFGETKCIGTSASRSFIVPAAFLFTKKKRGYSLPLNIREDPELEDIQNYDSYLLIKNSGFDVFGNSRNFGDYQSIDLILDSVRRVIPFVITSHLKNSLFPIRSSGSKNGNFKYTGLAGDIIELRLSEILSSLYVHNIYREILKKLTYKSKVYFEIFNIRNNILSFSLSVQNNSLDNNSIERSNICLVSWDIKNKSAISHLFFKNAEQVHFIRKAFSSIEIYPHFFTTEINVSHLSNNNILKINLFKWNFNIGIIEKLGSWDERVGHKLPMDYDSEKQIYARISYNHLNNGIFLRINSTFSDGKFLVLYNLQSNTKIYKTFLSGPKANPYLIEYDNEYFVSNGIRLEEYYTSLRNFFKNFISIYRNAFPDKKNQYTIINLSPMREVFFRSFRPDSDFLFADIGANKIIFNKDGYLKDINFSADTFQVSSHIDLEGVIEKIDYKKKLLVIKKTRKLSDSGVKSQIFDIYKLDSPRKIVSAYFNEHTVLFKSDNGFFAKFNTINQSENNVWQENHSLNRPDEILKLLNNTDENELNVYRKIREKLVRQDFKKNLYSQPILKIKNYQNLDKVRTKPFSPSIKIHARDSLNIIEGLRIKVNGITLSTDSLMKDKKSRKIVETSVIVPLSFGQNIIEISAVNSGKIESAKAKINIYHIPEDKPNSKLIFIGIGYAKYLDSNKRLFASGKDIRDLAELFAKQSDFILLDTLINIEKGIKDSLLLINDKLRNYDADDRIVVVLSGHGLLSKSKDEWHFATYNTNFENPGLTETITFKDIEELFQGVAARNRLVLIDACHAGQSYGDFLHPNSSDFESLNTRIENISKQKGLLSSPPFNMLSGFSEFVPEERFISLEYQAFEKFIELYPQLRNNSFTVLTASRKEETALENRENGLFTSLILETIAGLDSESKYNGEPVFIDEFITSVIAKAKENSSSQLPSIKSHNPSKRWVIWKKN